MMRPKAFILRALQASGLVVSLFWYGAVLAQSAPTISSFTPATGPVGTVITVTGTNLNGSTAAWVGSAHDAGVTNISSTSMQMTVPADAPVASDQLAVVTAGGTVWSGQNFTVTAAAAPTISSFTPSSGPVGTVITVTGTNLNGATAASVGSATDATVTNISSTSMQITVPADAPVASDQLAIVTPGGTVWSGQNFTVSAGSGTPAIAYVQGAYETPGTTGSMSLAYSSAQVAGDLNVVVVAWGDSTSTVSSVSDSMGNVYAAAGAITASPGNESQQIYYAKNIAAASAGGNTVTVTFSNSVIEAELRMAEYSGISQTNPLDGEVGAIGTGLTQNSGSLTTTNANDLLVAANGLNSVTTAAGTGYTLRITTGEGEILEDEAVSSAGSYSAGSTQQSSGYWLIQLAAFRGVASGGDTTAPTTPSGLTATATSSQITLNWTASTDNVGVTDYLIQRCAGASCTNFAQVGTSTTTSYTDTGLTASTSYSYRVQATDAAGNLSGLSSTATTATPAAGDTTPPTAPGTPSLTVVSSSQINLSWAASTDNVGVTGYLIQSCPGASCSNFAQIASVAGTVTSYSHTGLAASTAYSYRVQATDAAGNLSSYSGTASATTPAAADTQPPSNPTNLTATAGPMDTALAWTASTDNVGVTGYLIERCQGVSCTSFAQIATASGTATTYSDSAVVADANYSYRVRATDAAGNLSGYSNVTSDTPLDCD